MVLEELGMAELVDARQSGSLEEEVALNLWRTADRLQIHFTRLFREHGLTPQQYNVLRVLRGAREPLPCLEVAGRLWTMVPAITGLLDRLEQAELVVRKRSPEDRRVVFVELTDAGGRLLQALDAPVNALHRHLLGHMTEEELRRLTRLSAKARLHADG